MKKTKTAAKTDQPEEMTREDVISLAQCAGNVSLADMNDELRDFGFPPLSIEDMPTVAEILDKPLKDVKMDFGFIKDTRKKKPEVMKPEPIKMTTAQFKKKFKEEINSLADTLWREDKEHDYPSKAAVMELALQWTKNAHKEVEVTD